MKFNVKKTLIDPLISKKIEVPEVKNVMFLKDAGMYEAFNEIVGKQRDVMFGRPWKMITPVVISIVGFGGAAWEYGSRLVESGKLQDTAKLMINEAEAFIKSNK